MKAWALRAMLVVYAVALSAGLVACMGGMGGEEGGGGCGPPPTKCGEGTKRVKASGGGYKCVAVQPAGK